MKRILSGALIAISLLALTPAVKAEATSNHGPFYGTSYFSDDQIAEGTLLGATTVPTIISTCITVGGCKEILENAQEDAATFVASDGEIIGVQLQHAINTLRQIDIAKDLTDLELANAMLGAE